MFTIAIYVAAINKLHFAIRMKRTRPLIFRHYTMCCEVNYAEIVNGQEVSLQTRSHSTKKHEAIHTHADYTSLSYLNVCCQIIYGLRQTNILVKRLSHFLSKPVWKCAWHIEHNSIFSVHKCGVVFAYLEQRSMTACLPPHSLLFHDKSDAQRRHRCKNKLI